MPHTSGQRGPGDRFVDLVKPRLEYALRQYGGDIAVRIPILGDAIKASIRHLGAGVVREAALFGAGLGNLPRSLFPDGEDGDKEYRLANEAIGEVAQAIAHKGEVMTGEELDNLFDRIYDRLTGKSDGPIFGGTMQTSSAKVVYDRRAKLAHHETCVDAPPAKIERRTGGGGGRGQPLQQQRTELVPNLDRLELTFEQAEAQKVIFHDRCADLFGQKKDEKAKSKKEKKGWAELAQGLNQVDQDFFFSQQAAALLALDEAKKTKLERDLNRIETTAQLKAAVELVRKGVAFEVAVDIVARTLGEDAEEAAKKAQLALQKGLDDATAGLKKAGDEIEAWLTKRRAARAARR